MSDFQKAVDYTLQNEAGFVDDPRDPGGPTNWGITHETLSRWRARPVSTFDVKSLSRDQAMEIYKAYYWDTMALSQVKSDEVAMAVFDIGVNRGIHPSLRYAQQALNIHVDGVAGEKTQAALSAVDATQFLLKFIPAVSRGYIELCVENPARLVYLQGWVSRCHRLLNLLPGVHT